MASLTPKELLARYLETKQVAPEQREKLLDRAEKIFTDSE
jgi:hypothetical protein